MDKLSTDLYIRSRYRLATFFLSGNDWDTLVKEFFLKQSSISILKSEVEEINGEFSSLAESRAELENQKATLDAQKKDMDDSYALLAAEKARLQAELKNQNSTKSSLTAKIGSLTKDISQLQQFLIAAKSGGTIIDANTVPNSSSDPASSLAYFRSTAPGGSFAVFAFGAYTHRNGMSQWGARARAEAGQTYQQILAAYYPGKVFRTGSVINKSTGATEAIMPNISTTTYGVLNFEDDYLLRLNEMPESWSMQALEAQVIIARTFAINYTNNGQTSICTTESCQVIGDGQKTGAWAEAVRATRGVVLTDSAGKVFSSQYAAVHGGWGNNVGWDTRTGSGDYSNWTADAWESISGVSWFYKTWFRKGYATTGADCGHTPWLSNAEMADILNAYLLWISNGKTTSDPRIVSVDVYKCWGQTANPYSMTELKNLVSNPVTAVYSAVSANSNGTTTSISFNTNRGIVSMSGADFKAIYNMRAPSYLSIPQSSFVNVNVEYK
jgi:SpoIID/LytB domain protein